MYERYQIDVAEMLERDRTGPCFICQIVARHPDYPARIMYEDAPLSPSSTNIHQSMVGRSWRRVNVVNKLLVTLLLTST